MTHNGNAPLDGKQIKQLADSLLGAFTGFDDLARVVRVALNEPLYHIVDQRASLTDQVWKLVEWAEARGKVRDLIRAAVAQIPGNVRLRAAAEAVFGKGLLDEIAPQLPAGSPPSRPPSTENSMASGDATNPRLTDEQVLDDFPAYKASSAGNFGSSGLPPLGRLHGVPNLPTHLLPRPDALRALKAKLLPPTDRPLAITGAGAVGLHGMPGLGKTLLAVALAHDD